MAVALLVAAGSGERLGSLEPKAFVTLAGKPMVYWSIDILRDLGIEEIVVAIPKGTDLWGPGLTVVTGGGVRSESVRNALEASAGDPVIVHDAARPLVTADLFQAVLDDLERGGTDGAIAAARVADTVKQASNDGTVERTLDRSRLWAVQTPQAFRRAALEHALDVDDETLAAATDDAWLVERAGGTVRVVEAPARNFKITTEQDLRIAEDLLRC